MIGFYIKDRDGRPLSITDSLGERLERSYYASPANSMSEITWFDSPDEASGFMCFGLIGRLIVPDGLGVRVGLKQEPGNTPVLAIGGGPMAMELGYIPEDQEPSDTMMVTITERLIDVPKGMRIRDQIRNLYRSWQ